MGKKVHFRSASEKERIIKVVEQLGVIAGCRKEGIQPKQYYLWLERYEAQGLPGLADRRSSSTTERRMQQLEKELKLYKVMVAEKDLRIRMLEEVVKKKS